MIQTVDISRAQFAFTIACHIIFPAFSIGLSTFLVIMEAAYLKTQKSIYLSICQFWIKIFALTFGMGVVSGIVMEVQIGTNWSGFSQAVGPVLGALFTYEAMTAFFIEAGFLGVMLFGWKKVGPKLHFLATCLVCVGVTVSAFWILAANSWMQTPAGAVFKNHQFVVTDWAKVIFNPSTVIRFSHMLIATYLATAFVILSVSSFYLLNRVYTQFAKKCCSFALWVILALAPTQIFIGDVVGLLIHEYQPLKTAAIEANWQTQRSVPLVLFAYPEQKEQKNEFSVSIPKLASLINTHSFNGKLVGLSSVPVHDQPVVVAVFYSFRVMVGIGILMLFIAFAGIVLRLRHSLYDTKWFQRLCVCLAPAGFLAIITGWITAECGRQPWVVYGFIRTTKAASPVSLAQVVSVMVLICIVYFLIFGVFYMHYLRKIIRQGPRQSDELIGVREFGVHSLTRTL